jgi:hypothetical protein
MRILAYIAHWTVLAPLLFHASWRVPAVVLLLLFVGDLMDIIHEAADGRIFPRR